MNTCRRVGNVSYIDQSKNKDDVVRPGEQWFFYWKTSPALWEGKIQAFLQTKKIFIPVNWGVHFDGVGWDFHGDSPEKDLYRLVELICRNNLQPVFLLPVSPAPFLINGGVPHVAAKTPSKDDNGLYLISLDQEKKLNKMYSFFEPAVFKAFSDFLAHFKIFTERLGKKIEIKALDCYYRSDSEMKSYFGDESIAFDQGFSRYLKMNFGDQIDLSTLEEEKRLRTQYHQEVRSLFKTVISSVLKLEGRDVLEVVFLGGATIESIERSFDFGRSDQHYLEDFFDNYFSQRLVSSSLLHEKEKTDILKAVIQEHYSGSRLERMHEILAGSYVYDEFRDLELFSLFMTRKDVKKISGELIELLRLNYAHLYKVYDEIPKSIDWFEAQHESIKTISGEWVTEENFASVMKLFLMGQKVVIDKASLREEFERRILLFITENSLRSQQVRFHTHVTLYELGEGRLMIFNSDEITDQKNKYLFWNQVMSYLNVKNLAVKMDDELHAFWRVRESQPHELNFLDVRRVSFYNPTSYKKSVFIQGQKHFAYMKMIDPTKAKAISSPKGVDVELMPKGMISLDFGHFEEAL